MSFEETPRKSTGAEKNIDGSISYTPTTQIVEGAAAITPGDSPNGGSAGGETIGSGNGDAHSATTTADSGDNKYADTTDILQKLVRLNATKKELEEKVTKAKTDTDFDVMYELIGQLKENSENITTLNQELQKKEQQNKMSSADYVKKTPAVKVDARALFCIATRSNDKLSVGASVNATMPDMGLLTGIYRTVLLGERGFDINSTEMKMFLGLKSGVDDKVDDEHVSRT